MELNSFSTNFAALFIGTVSTTYAFTDSTDGYAIRVWDQFGSNLRKIDDLNNKEEWDWWTERWVYLVLSHKSSAEKQLTSDYWKNTVIEIGANKPNELFLNKAIPKVEEAQKYSKDNDIKKKELALNNKKELFDKVKKLQDECRWAYGRYVNKDISHEKSWFHAISKRTNVKVGEELAKSYEYWKDVYRACSILGLNNNLPLGWLSKETIHIYESKNLYKSTK
ncbi:hypothetical protein MHSWG343_03870 [Candidatus Mycoplasma haematohominis]|uniref:Uncharacterized protein n=1 Tax=Candidatus Mycoplasma haematohominis TaxID=1494318 RepID=A0A478FPP7_9MOLU|nr:hypothetical protein MHSWG343_03870 [Candidatus Mycoplasma haemohominis]